MVVCSCNVITAKQVVDAVAAGVTRPRDIYAACGCKADCGCCTATILGIVRDRTPAAAG